MTESQRDAFYLEMKQIGINRNSRSHCDYELGKRILAAHAPTLRVLAEYLNLLIAYLGL